MFQNVLVAVDSSEASLAALAHAADLAKAGGGRVVLMNVVDAARLVAVAGFQAPYPSDTIELMRDEGRRVLEEARSICAARSVPVTTVVTEGEPCEEILRVAQLQRVDLIALGTHGRGGVPRLVLGSVAEGVLRRATVPVLIVRG